MACIEQHFQHLFKTSNIFITVQIWHLKISNLELNTKCREDCLFFKFQKEEQMSYSPAPKKKFLMAKKKAKYRQIVAIVSPPMVTQQYPRNYGRGE